MHVAIVGATGLVGEKIIELLRKRNFPFSKLSLFASSEKQPNIFSLESADFSEIDLSFLCVSNEIAQKCALARKTGLMIDSSSAFRLDPNVPLVIPEINAAKIKNAQLIASPNCVATLMALALAPLHRLFSLSRVIASTYQAASGAGRQGLDHLWEETRSAFEPNPLRSFPYPYAFNLFLHPPEFGEEKKIREEIPKILNHPSLKISVTAVRVPVLYAHSISLNMEFENAPHLEEAEDALRQAPGITYLDASPSPRQVEGKEEVFCARLRRDLSHPRCLELWIVGDQLLKGAALNAVQIAESWLRLDDQRNFRDGVDKTHLSMMQGNT